MNSEQHLYNLSHLELRLAPTAKTGLKVKVKVFRDSKVCPKINNTNRRMRTRLKMKMRMRMKMTHCGSSEPVFTPVRGVPHGNPIGK